jgi:hypothetical protein
VATKRIHVNQHVIRLNQKHAPERRLPACRVEEGSKTLYGTGVKINGPSELIYRPDDPLRCGARLWIETEADIEIENAMTYPEVKALLADQK